MKRFLLDTNMLLGFSRQASWALWANAEFEFDDSETVVFTSVICRGEILALAEKRGWGEVSRVRLEDVLGRFPTIDINREPIIEAYARIDAWTHGKPVASPRDTPPPRPAVAMSQNDLWIAATSHVTQTTLVSTDGDFDHLNGIWINRVYVDQQRHL